MKKISIFLILTIIFLCSTSMLTKKMTEAKTNIIKKISEKFEKKYRMTPCGIHESMFSKKENRIIDKWTHLGLSFQCYGKLNKHEARRLIVMCMQEMLQEINLDAQIRPFLSENPFGIENISISIFFHGEGRCSVYHPYIDIVSGYLGDVSYTTEDPNDRYKSIMDDEESFETALEIVKQERQSPGS